jgi:hypothetical protein
MTNKNVLFIGQLGKMNHFVLPAGITSKGKIVNKWSTSSSDLFCSMGIGIHLHNKIA